MSNIEYKLETLDECLDEMIPIIEAHWEEVSMYQDKVKLSPDWDMYRKVEEADALVLMTVRDEGKLIGYFVFFVQPHMHYSEDVFAVTDALYLDQGYRHSDVSISMFIEAEEFLRQSGVSVIKVSMKTHAPFDSLCEAMGYFNVERIYSKYIGDK